MDYRNISIVAPARSLQPGKVAFIASTSFERRCLHVARNLSSKYRADAAILCQWSGDYELQQLQDSNFAELRKTLTFKLNQQAVNNCILRTYEPHATLPILRDAIKELATHEITHVDFDISTFTKQYLLIFLNLLDELLPEASVRVLYTPADRYGAPHATRPYLSRRVRRIIAVPGFDHFLDAIDVPQTIVLFLGFEELRAGSLVTALKPEMCIPVLQHRRNTHLGSKLIVDANARLLAFLTTRYGVQPQTVDGENPTDAFELLKSLYGECVRDKGHTLLVAPHGSKMEAVGAYLFWRAAADPNHIGFVYAMPLRYNERNYSGDPIGYIAEFQWNWSTVDESRLVHA